VVVFKQVQNIEKSKASIVEVVPCFDTVEAGIQVRQSDSLYIPSQVKSTFSDNSEKTRIMTVIYSCQMYLHFTSLVLHVSLNGPLYLLKLNALIRFLRLQQLNGKMLNHVSSICLRETFLLMKLK